MPLEEYTVSNEDADAELQERVSALRSALHQEAMAASKFYRIQWTGEGVDARRAMEAAHETTRLVRNAFEQTIASG